MAYTTINKSTAHFNTKLYTGTGSSNAQTGIGHQPDLVWIKSRSAGWDHEWYDAVRGVGKSISSVTANAEGNSPQGVTAFGSDGFTVGTRSGVNENNSTYASWNWKAGGSASANTDGSLSSSVSANQTSGFSIVTYNGRDATDTIGHGLGAEPSVILFKCRSHTGSDWYSYWKPLGNNSTIRLNTADAVSSPTGLWNTTNPTSSVFTVTSSDVINRVGRTFVAYCFAEKQGYSKFGSYTGNGNANGTFIYTGFSPAFVMIKKSSANNGWWQIEDNKRDVDNPAEKAIFANVNDAEYSGSNYYVDYLSNGFKCRSTQAGSNTSGGSYIYMAFAEAPLVGTNNVPCTAR